MRFQQNNRQAAETFRRHKTLAKVRVYGYLRLKTVRAGSQARFVESSNSVFARPLCVGR